MEANNTLNPKAGLGALLTPDNCALILIDHQPFQFAGLRSHDTQTIINNVVGLTKSAKAFGVPTLFTTVVEHRGGFLIKQLQDIFPDQKPIDRTFINTWEDTRVTDWVKATGKKKYASQCPLSRRWAKDMRFTLLRTHRVA
jgi:nicotinamidase-related amidase